MMTVNATLSIDAEELQLVEPFFWSSPKRPVYVAHWRGHVVSVPTRELADLIFPAWDRGKA
jgi:hypothetical protein